MWPVVSTLTSTAAMPRLTTRCDLQPLPACADRVERVADHVDGNAEIDQRAEHHVAGGAARAVDVQVRPRSGIAVSRHGAVGLAGSAVQRCREGAWKVPLGRSLTRTASRAILTAATAAPTPLSMLTTVMPGAHADSSAPSATRPSIETP